MHDDDIKIAGNRPSLSIKENSISFGVEAKPDESITNNAKEFGKRIAEEFSLATLAYADAVEDVDENMLVQRHLLLSFTAAVGFENSVTNEMAAGIAQKSFLDAIRLNYPELYKYTSDTGAFSFYYLAHRRGSEIERRIGQTFAMLCAHDGDPIYQELGEVLYCWFTSRIRELAKEYKLN